MKISSRIGSSEFLGVVFVVVALFVALAFDNWRISRPGSDQAYVPKVAVMTPEIELLQEYIRFDTSNPPGREIEAARWIAELLQRAGIDSEIIESAPGRANVIARLEGRRKGEGLLLTHHIDVTPADADLWEEPPFAANVRMNQLYGRGVLDMKSVGICHLVAFMRLVESSEPLERDVMFLAVADEETGGTLGMGWLVRNRPDVFEGIRYAVNEGGVAESLRDEITYFGVEVGSKELVRLDLRSDDRRSLEKARIALLPLQSPEDPDRVLPELPETLTKMSEARLWGRDLLEDVEQTIAEGEFWRLHASYKYMMQNVVRLAGIETTDDGFTMRAVLENLSDQEPEPVIERVRGVVEPLGVEVRVVALEGPTPISSWHTPFYALIEDSVHAIYGDVPVGPQIQPFTSNDSRYLRRIGIESYGFWPFPVTLYQTFGIHKVDERVRLDWFMNGVEMTTSLVRSWATDGR